MLIKLLVACVLRLQFLPHLSEGNELTYCSLVMPYGVIELGQHCFMLWLVAWRHQANTWTNVVLSSVRFCGINLMAISRKMLNISIHGLSLKITNLRLKLQLPGCNEFGDPILLGAKPLWSMIIYNRRAIKTHWSVDSGPLLRLTSPVLEDPKHNRKCVWLVVSWILNCIWNKYYPGCWCKKYLILFRYNQYFSFWFRSVLSTVPCNIVSHQLLLSRRKILHFQMRMFVADV